MTERTSDGNGSRRNPTPGEQVSLPLELGAFPALRQPAGPVQFRAGPRTVVVTECFDAYWRFAAERQHIFHRRASGTPPPWTTDPILLKHKFTSVYRAADRVSQYLIRNVIYSGMQEPQEVLFRILLFKFFNRIETWQLLTSRLGAPPAWASYDFTTYNRVLDQAIGSGERIYSAAYIVPNPRRFEDEAPVSEIAAQDAAAVQPDRPQTAKSGLDRMRPLAVGPGRHLKAIAHFLHIAQQDSIW